MTTEWHKVLESKLDLMLSSSQTLKSSLKSLHGDFERLDSYINSLQVQNDTNPENLADDEQLTFMPYFEEFFEEDQYHEFPDFYCLRFRRKSHISSFMPHVFIV